MNFENNEESTQKLKAGIVISQAYLQAESGVQEDLDQFNLKFQAVLQNIFEHSQASLPFFEGLTAKLSAEENQVLVQSAAHTTAAHQQLFEIWKAYKELGARTIQNRLETEQKLKALAEK